MTQIGQELISLKGYADGIYIVQINFNGRSEQVRVIKEKKEPIRIIKMGFRQQSGALLLYFDGYYKLKEQFRNKKDVKKLTIAINFYDFNVKKVNI